MNTLPKGFALPTVLISSVVLLLLLMVGIEGVANMRQNMDAQYYTQLAKEAAESGVQQLENCINKSFENDIPLTTSTVYTPNMQCDGSAMAGVSQYVLQTPRYRTTYSAQIDSSTVSTYKVRVQARIDLLRSSTGATWKTYDYSLNTDATKGLFSSSSSAIGYYEVCGVIDAKTWCWGNNENGQLGDNTTNNSLVPVRVLRESGMLAGRTDTGVAVGKQYACNISSNEVFCWGVNDRGQLGNGTTTGSRKPIKVNHATGLAGKTLTQIATTEATTCVVASGDLYCWGDSRFGQLGINVGISSWSNTSSTYYRTSPVKVSVIGKSVAANLEVTKVAATPNSRHICAVVVSGDSYCWGGNDQGQLGWSYNNYNDQYYPRPIYRGGGIGTKTITDIAVGGWINEGYSGFGGHTCAIADGSVFCWGANDEGQMGNGTAFSASPGNGYTVPIIVNSNGLPTTGMQQVGVGYWHSCARRGNEIWCWGQNYYGELGLGFTGSRRTTPQKLPTTTNELSGKTITDMAAGVYRVCVVADFSTYCWGNNDVGQIGDGTTVTRNTATEAYFLRSKIPSVKF